MIETATKIHITLNQPAAKDPEERRFALEKIVDLSGIRDVNQNRLDRFGIITGIVDSSKINVLRKMSEVRSVSVDEERHAL
jgi:hypothetical protein